MKIKAILQGMALTATIAAATAQAAGKVEVDAALPDYSKASGVAGNLSSVGADMLANLMTLWAENYKKLYPNVNIQIQAACLDGATGADLKALPTSAR